MLVNSTLMVLLYVTDRVCRSRGIRELWRQQYKRRPFRHSKFESILATAADAVHSRTATIYINRCPYRTIPLSAAAFTPIPSLSTQPSPTFLRREIAGAMTRGGDVKSFFQQRKAHAGAATKPTGGVSKKAAQHQKAAPGVHAHSVPGIVPNPPRQSRFRLALLAFASALTYPSI
jgi:hypothetical protein